MLACHWATVRAARGPAGTGGLEIGNAGASVHPDGCPWEGSISARHDTSTATISLDGMLRQRVTLLTFSFLFVEDAPLTQTVSKIRSNLISIERGG